MKNLTLKKPIVLVGLMGAGKTSVGMQLAANLGLRFIDSDKEIESQAGATIAEIFKRDGEEFFRKVESKYISTLLNKGGMFILATGGGAFINAETRKQIKEKAISVWLKADLETMLTRVNRTGGRPLLANSNKQEVLEKLINDRYPIYAEADIIINSNPNSHQIVAENIEGELQKYAA